MTRQLAGISAVLLGVSGLGLLFAASEVTGAFGAAEGPLPGVIGQLLGAAWLSLAAVTWLTRGTPQGGIYGRPIVMANTSVYFISALVCARAAGSTPSLWIPAAVTALMALAYGRLLFGGPVK